MAKRSITADLAQPSVDPVSDILKWVLLVTAIVCFALLGWATVLTYEKAPPHPQAFTDRAGNVLMTADDIVAGKGGFQKADLMDYGSIYGMGSYFGEDYTASTLVRLGVLTKQSLANSGATPPGTKAPGNKSLADHRARRNAARADDARRRIARRGARRRRRHRDDAEAASGRSISPSRRSSCRTPSRRRSAALQAELTTKLNTVNLSAGWVPAKSLDPVLRKQTADFIIYSAITTVARRPDHPEHVMDRELAVRAVGRQHADDQHLPLDLDQLLLHLLRDGVRAVALPGLSRPSRRRADGDAASRPIAR